MCHHYETAEQLAEEETVDEELEIEFTSEEREETTESDNRVTPEPTP